jgi:hypothetical protein
MMLLNRNLTHEEQATLFQAMTAEQLKALKGTPVKINWSDDDLKEITAFQEAEKESYSALFNVLQHMTSVEAHNFTLLKSMSMIEKMEKTGLSQFIIETIENDASQAIYGDILRYCKRLGIPKELILESFLEKEMV